MISFAEFSESESEYTRGTRKTGNNAVIMCQAFHDIARFVLCARDISWPMSFGYCIIIGI